MTPENILSILFGRSNEHTMRYAQHEKPFTEQHVYTNEA